MSGSVGELLAQELSGPILFHYIWWVLLEAEKRNIRRLYFLARDGYLLREIAQLFCNKFHLPIECRYLYVSRASLRMPVYQFIGEEAYELLMLDGYRVSLKSLLQRVDLSESQRYAVYADCGIANPDENRQLQKPELESLRPVLKTSNLLHQFILEKSAAAYVCAIGYLRQEGLFEQRDVATVDSGWGGTTQRLMRQLLCSAGFSGTLTGFYFGTYSAPRSVEDGTFLSWYFSYNARTKNKISFCPNLFECLVSAPHGMTVGYMEQDGHYLPRLNTPPQESELIHIKENNRLVFTYTVERLESTDFRSFNTIAALKDTNKRVCRYMAFPHKEEAEFLGQYMFCDDITGTYYIPLASMEQVKQLTCYSVPARVWRKLFSKKGTIQELFWPLGTVSFLPWWKQWWYRINIFVWELLKCSVIR